jgi:hypothetical protein
LYSIGQQQHLKGNLIRFECSGLFAYSNDMNGFDGITLPDGINDILSFDHVTKDSMFAVQPGSACMGNKKWFIRLKRTLLHEWP